MSDDDFTSLTLRLDSALSDLESGHSLAADVGLVVHELRAAIAEPKAVLGEVFAQASIDVRAFAREIHLTEWVSQALSGLRVG